MRLGGERRASSGAVGRGSTATPGAGNRSLRHTDKGSGRVRLPRACMVRGNYHLRGPWEKITGEEI